VVATNEHVSQRLRFRHHFVGIAAIADGIAQIDNEVVSGRGGQASVERFEVTVNVAK